ncbi:MAG: LON peptidase substrate-binding domain-containing protein, partial [Terriglobia bacterium]
MAEKGKKTTKVNIPSTLPLIPLRDLVLFPNLVLPLNVGREKSLNALEEALGNEHLVILAVQKEAEKADPEQEDLFPVGCAATIMQELKLPDGTARALVEGFVRVRIEKFVQMKPFIKVKATLVEDETKEGVETEALMRNLLSQFEKYAQLGKPVPQEVLVAAGNIDDPSRLADFVAFHLNLRTEEKQAVLEALNVRERMETVGLYLTKEIELLEIGGKIQSRVREQMSKTQREYFLREQMKAIQKELGTIDEHA